MSTATVTRDDVVAIIDTLPTDKWQELVDFVEFLQFKTTKQSSKPIKLGGLWQHLPPLTEESIDEMRQEMWGNWGNREL